MPEKYRVSIHGKRLEGRNLRRLLARAVREKREIDRLYRFSAAVEGESEPAAPANADDESDPYTISSGAL